MKRYIHRNRITALIWLWMISTLTDYSQRMQITQRQRNPIFDLCKNSENAPASTDILYYLRSRFDLETVELVGNVLPQKNVCEILPEKVEVVPTSTCSPTTGTKAR